MEISRARVAFDWYKVSSYAGEQKPVSRSVKPMAAPWDPVIPKPPDCRFRFRCGSVYAGCGRGLVDDFAEQQSLAGRTHPDSFHTSLLHSRAPGWIDRRHRRPPQVNSGNRVLDVGIGWHPGGRDLYSSHQSLGVTPPDVCAVYWRRSGVTGLDSYFPGIGTQKGSIAGIGSERD